MRIEGFWAATPTGALRPMLLGAVRASATRATHFLVDCGATRTVLSLSTASKLGVDLSALPSFTVEGVGGQAACVLLPGTVTLVRETGEMVTIGGPFLAFLSPDSGDDDLLGNDVLANFDVILSRPRNEVLLLAREHTYEVVRRTEASS